MSKAEKKPGIVLAIHRPDDLKGKDKVIGGSMSDGWNDAIAGQVVNTLWTKHLDDDEANKLRAAAVEALIGIKPKDEIEGMIAAQLVACHNASMECYRRAMLPDSSVRPAPRQSQFSEQALADVFDASRDPQSAPWQRPAEDDGRARPRSRRRPGHRRQRREPGGWVRTEIKGTTPCTWICTRHHDAERGHDAGACVSRRR